MLRISFRTRARNPKWSAPGGGISSDDKDCAFAPCIGMVVGAFTAPAKLLRHGDDR
jgi:hypothetical protein